MTRTTNKKIGVIACGVLEWNIRRIAAEITDVDLLLHFLPAQLHENPMRLRELLQEKIDELEMGGDLAGIVVGFGVCGRGTIGISAQRVPLAFPRTQDCIGIFLGSHARHQREFNSKPGTRYLTCGWYEKTLRDRPRKHFRSARDHSLYGVTREELENRYGLENAEFICEFRESWKRNYQRSAYIRFPAEDGIPPGQAIAQGLADSLDWEHAVLDGDESLLLALLTGDWGDSRILLVPPGNKTVSAPGEAVIGFTAGVDSQVEDILRKYDASAQTGPPQRSGLGLGVDTGGTFTDAVIHDFSAAQTLAYAKAPTTHENLVDGIKAALEQLPQDLLRQVGRVGLSTTLATNAFVERKGRPVALLLMSPVTVHLDRLPFRYVRAIDGAMTMDGEERSALNQKQVRECALEAKAAGCEAFAISGFGSVVNPRHEQEAARIAYDATGLHAVCGHELTNELNFMDRATTAAMNAKLIPMIEELLAAVEQALAHLGLQDVKVMVVKGDGSHMLDRVAREFPVETVLSGPAASVVGAAQLFANADAAVVDMGGTTLDVALIRNGAPILSETGARIGEFQTSIKAMAIQTIGLGGDSEIDLSRWPKVRIGPRRIVPLCRLHEDQSRIIERLPTLVRDYISFDANCIDIVALAPGTTASGRVLELLASGPMLLGQLARRMSRSWPAHIPWRELEDAGKITRYGLTLTDILHYERKFTAFDRITVEQVIAYWAMLLDVDAADIVERVHHEFRRLVCDTVLEVTVPKACPWRTTEALRDWLTAHFAQSQPGDESPVTFRAELACPLIAVGAPVATLFPELQSVLNQEILISDFASVANAIGAIAGDVLLREAATVKVGSEGAFVCSWRGGAARAVDFRDAMNRCERELIDLVRREAAANDIPYRQPFFNATKHEARTRDGVLLLGVTLQAELRG